MTLRTVHLHGHLVDKYTTQTIEIDGDTAYLCMQGLYSALGEEFQQEVRDNKWQLVRGKIREDMENTLSEEQVHMLLGNEPELHLIPVIEGSSGIGRIILGIVLILVAVFQPQLIPAIIGQQAILGMGISMVLGGVMELLSPTPKVGKVLDAGAPAERPSFVFNGAINVMEQGGPVPLLYGHIGRCGTVVISAGIEAEAY